MSRTKIASAAVGWTLLCSAAAWAQPLTVTPMFRQYANTARMRLTIMSGRVVNTADWRFGNGTSSTSDGKNKEQITFRGGMGVTNTGGIDYERTTPQEEFTISINSDGNFRFRRSPKGSSSIAPIQFSQVPGEPLTLTIGAEGKQQEYRGATLWHLLMANPQEARPVVEILEQLRPQWQVAKVTAAVEAELLKSAGTKRPDRQQWAALVQQLADDQFTRREAADRQLRAAGAGVLGYLQQLDFNQLDAEQQSRIRQMIKSLSRQTTDDTPEQVAAWLSEDPSVWLVLLARPDESVRRTAARQLAAILGESIPVDPAADPATQKDQRETLRARIEKARPSTPKPAKS
jgi:hypothetical protein